MDSIKEMQGRLDKLPAMMSAKGLRQPDADFTLRANAQHRFYLSHKLENGVTNRGYEFFDTADEAEEWIAGLPSIDETRKLEFLTQLAKTIELGKANGIDAVLVAPLMEAMKKLSENAIEHHP